MGANALLEGHYFESVGCFIASVERFREWKIKFIWYLNGIDEKKSDDLWKKHFKNFSERQLGAFSAIFFDHFNEPPLIFDDNQKNLETMFYTRESFSLKMKHINWENMFLDIYPQFKRLYI